MHSSYTPCASFVSGGNPDDGRQRGATSQRSDDVLKLRLALALGLISLVLGVGCNYLAVAGYMLWWPWTGHW